MFCPIKSKNITVNNLVSQSRFFLVDFRKEPLFNGDNLAVPINCEHCGRLLHWRIPPQKWAEMKAEHEVQKALG